MLYLSLAAICSLLLVIIFKLFNTYEVESFQAIVCNYIVCVLIGSILGGSFPVGFDVHQQAWFPFMLSLGFLFIGGFYIASQTVKHFGIAVASVAQRMSIIISVTFAIIYFNEAATITKIIGIFFAIASVVLINLPDKKDQSDPSSNTPSIRPIYYLMPLSILLISGFIEAILQYVHMSFTDLDSNQESTILFSFAAFNGIVVTTFLVLTGRLKLQLKSILWGIILGIPNYFSIFFLLVALNSIDASIAYPINNIFVVSTSAIAGYFVFSEKLNTFNVLGVVASAISIFLIALSSYSSHKWLNK